MLDWNKIMNFRWPCWRP